MTRTSHPPTDPAFGLAIPAHAVWIALLACLFFSTRADAAQGPTNPPVILTVEGTNVFVQRFQSNAWESAFPNQILGDRDRGRTGLRSRTSVRLSDLSVLRIGELSEFEIQPLQDQKVEAEFSLFRGLLYLLNRDRPGKHRFVTPTATAATRGTEFNLEVDPATGRTVLTVLEGEAELSNAAGSIIIASGEQGVALLGQVPTRTPVIDTTNIVQWCLYYPAVLDVDELSLGPEQAALADSLAAYRTGDLLAAVSRYPANRTPASDSERLYAASLLLAVGQVSAAEALLDPLHTTGGRTQELAGALIRMIHVVNRRRLEEPGDGTAPTPSTATAHLAESYRLQSEYRIEPALEAARLATELNPRFAFAWARVAELEFSLGRSGRARAALETSLGLAPRNAQAVALRGFVLAAENRVRDAEEVFTQAIALDGGLGNAWLGRGLCRIRRGRDQAGRLDLQVAATAEPQRSLLRSYLGKAFSNVGDARHAESELRLARQLDEGDPTPWLYSALLLQQQNRINEGVVDLEHSRELNDNRRVYRSRLLLDQDRAARGASLANLYRDAGMTDWSVQEAGRSVSADYTSFSSHLFLADSFNLLRDPRQVNQRYETPWFTEFIVANMLAPVGASSLSQTVSQNEYSRLLESDGLGIVSSTEYYSHGEWRQGAVQYGSHGRSAYAAEVAYVSDNGWRPNNDSEQLSLALTLKQELTAHDSVLLRAGTYHSEVGDVSQRYSNTGNRTLRIDETQDISALVGYHHEWNPGHHTLLLAGRFPSRQDVQDEFQNSLFFYRPFGPVTAVSPAYFEQDYHDDVAIYSAELQQLAQLGDHTFILGARFQLGSFETSNLQTNGRVVGGTGLVPIPGQYTQEGRPDLDRKTFYAYDQWRVWPTLLLCGGVSYDRLTFPENYRLAPTTDQEDRREEFCPKGGFVFTPFTDTAIRGAYFKSLGGASFDHAVRLEPSQVAGFNQAYFSLIPESVAGASVAPVMDGWALSLEQQVLRKTYLSIGGEWLGSEVDRQLGAVQFLLPATPGPAFTETQTRQLLNFNERTLVVAANQLVGREWSFGVRYRLSDATLDTLFPDIPVGAATSGGLRREEHVASTLHQLTFSGLFNHPSGFFAGASAIWNQQSNRGYTPDLPGDDFWQFNVEGGWRFLRRRLEIRTGVLNIADHNYRLAPLNLTTELPRGREVFASLRFNF